MRQLHRCLRELLVAVGTPPFPVGNRKYKGNWGVNKQGTDWLGHRDQVYYLPWEISNRFITLQRESGQAEFPATRAAGCEPENQGRLCVRTTCLLWGLETGLLLVGHKVHWGKKSKLLNGYSLAKKWQSQVHVGKTKIILVLFTHALSGAGWWLQLCHKRLITNKNFLK